MKLKKIVNQSRWKIGDIVYVLRANEDKSQIAYVKMDGNRRIRVFKKTLSSVRAEISDLPIQKKLSQKPE